MTSDGADHEWWRLNDVRFCAAMRKAIRADREHPPAMRVMVDHTPPAPGTRIFPAMRVERSFVGSPSAWCAVWGDERKLGNSW